METEIKKACVIVGSQTKLAKAIGVTIGAVNHWVSGRGSVPVGRCPAIERITDGAVRCEDLRPDVEWSVLRVPAEEAA